MTDTVLTTRLNQWHRRHGAKMSCFCSYEMPLWYGAGARDEHLAVLRTAGLFDTSHMAMIMVQGPGAFELLQYCFSKDLLACIGERQTPLVPGKAVYGVFLAHHGYVIDDAIIFQLDTSLYVICVNASMGQSVSHHLEDEKAGFEVTITDLTGRLAKLDIQGPAAARVLTRVLREPQAALAGLSYFSCRGHFAPDSRLADSVRLFNNTPVLLGRAGYTGEFGFELYLQPDSIETIWETMLAAGRDLGLMPCGLAARDSLRTGAVLPLSHQDIGNWPFLHNPWQFALPYSKDHRGFTKDFIGAQALLTACNVPFTHAFAGFDPRKVERGQQTLVIDDTGETLGTVLTCVTDMGIDRVDGRIVSISSPGQPEDFRPRGLSCGFIKVARELPVGAIVFLKDGRRQIKVEIRTDIRPHRTARLPMQEML